MPTIQEQLDELARTVEACRSVLPAVEAAVPPLLETLRAGGRVLSCGNGGSAADAMHLAEELVGRYNRDRRAYSAICLNADATALTCIANDWNFDAVFSRQVEAHGRPGDLLVAFTTSGKSPNIAAALQAAKKAGVKTLLLTGKTGGTCLALADHAVVVPSENTARIQEIHGWILHVLLEAVETLPAA